MRTLHEIFKALKSSNYELFKELYLLKFGFEPQKIEFYLVTLKRYK